MAVSKLFTPQIREKRGDALDRTEEPDLFANTPLHPEVPASVFRATSGGEACYPLRMSRTNCQQFTGGIQRRKFRTRNDGGEY